MSQVHGGQSRDGKDWELRTFGTRSGIPWLSRAGGNVVKMHHGFQEASKGKVSGRKSNRVKRACRCENKMPTEKPQRRGLHSPQGEGPGLAWMLRNELQGGRGIALVDFGILYSPGECLLGHSLPVNNQLANAPCSDAYVIADEWRWEGHSSSRVQGAGDRATEKKSICSHSLIDPHTVQWSWC